MGIPELSISDALPERITICNCAMKFDGGTVVLYGHDAIHREWSIVLASSLPSRGSSVSGRLYFGGALVPMRSEREAHILRLLSEAQFDIPPLPPQDRHAPAAIVGKDIQDFFEQTPEESCRNIARQIIERVQSEDYLRYITDEEYEMAKSLAEEATSDEWQPRSAKKRRRDWRDGSGRKPQ